MKLRKYVCLLAFILALSQTIPCYAGTWQEQFGTWRYEEDGHYISGTWKWIDDGWYRFDSIGNMQTGWFQDTDGAWYFLNPVSNGTRGRMMTGWQWIDGRCYYLSETTAEGQPSGSMISNGITPDGYRVNQSGAWVDENGNEVLIPGKGIQTVVKTASSRSAGRGGGGGFSSGSSGSSGSNNSQPESEKPGEDPEEQIPGGNPDGGADETPDLPPSEASPPDASPSEADMVDWQIHFVDQETHQIHLAPSRKGKIKDGEDLTVNFLSKIIDGQKRIWEALETPPVIVSVYGPGQQIYYIEYEQTGVVPDEEDPFRDEKEKLEAWIRTAKEQEAQLTGETAENIPDERVIVKTSGENDKRLLTAAGQIANTDEHLIYVIGKNVVPDGTILKTVYREEIEYSNLAEEAITIGEDVYSISRFGVVRTYNEENCLHEWEITNETEAACLQKGVKRYLCGKCGIEEKVYIPALGHIDHDGDSVCDRCGDNVNDGAADPNHWKLGDVQAREIDGKTYLFRCIDQNYSDQTENHRQAALFLCDTVIPANYGSKYVFEELATGIRDYVFYAGPVVNFGASNDYKYSNIRTWLKAAGDDMYQMESINIGVSHAYTGMTEEGRYSQLTEASLRPSYIGNQKMADKLFILSVDEALRYKDWLWRFNGSDGENPESQTGAFSKGYWLRNPMGTDQDYDSGFVYTVDLLTGNIRPQKTKPDAGDGIDAELEVTGSIGVRPVFAVPQE